MPRSVRFIRGRRWLFEDIKSLKAQTIEVDVYLVVDGPLTIELDKLIDEHFHFFWNN